MPAWLAPLAISGGLALGKKLFGGGGGKSKAAPYDPYADVGKAQDLTRESVNAYGRQLQPQMMREIGTALGDLNSIGALRSGGPEQAVTDISNQYADRIGNYAQEATGNAIGYGMEAGRMRSDRDAADRERKAATLRSIGNVLGAGIGFYAQSKFGGGGAARPATGNPGTAI